MSQKHVANVPSPSPISYWALLRHNRAYRRLWLGLVVSTAGDWFRMIALFHLVLQLTGTSGLALGGVLVAQSLFMFLLSPIAGVWADRLSRKTIMIASDLVRSVLTLGFLLLTSAEHIWLAYVLTAAIMAVASFFHPAHMATIPNITQRDELVTANALTSSSWAAMLALGSGLGGMVTAALGVEAAFCIDAATYIVSALCIATVPIPVHLVGERGAETASQQSGWQTFVQGLRYLHGRSLVRRLLSVKAWSAGIGGSIVLLSTLFAEDVYRAGVTGMGTLNMVRGIGAVCGPILARRLVGQAPQAMYRSIGVAFFVMGLLYALFSRMPTLSSAAVVLCVSTMASNVLWVFSSTLLQLSVPDAYRGRVFAADFALLTVVMALSTFVTGWMLDHLGLSPRAVTLGLGGLLCVPGLLWLSSAVRRDARALPDGGVAESRR